MNGDCEKEITDASAILLRAIMTKRQTFGGCDAHTGHAASAPGFCCDVEVSMTLLRPCSLGGCRFADFNIPGQAMPVSFPPRGRGGDSSAGGRNEDQGHKDEPPVVASLTDRAAPGRSGHRSAPLPTSMCPRPGVWSASSERRRWGQGRWGYLLHVDSFFPGASAARPSRANSSFLALHARHNGTIHHWLDTRPSVITTCPPTSAVPRQPSAAQLERDPLVWRSQWSNQLPQPQLRPAVPLRLRTKVWVFLFATMVCSV